MRSRKAVWNMKMQIKIFDLNDIPFDVVDKKRGFTNMVNDFCKTVDVIDIVVLNISKMVVKYTNL